MSILDNSQAAGATLEMRMFSSAQAKNHFGELIDAARLAPVAVTKYDRPFVVVMAIEEFERLKLRSVDGKKSPLPTGKI